MSKRKIELYGAKIQIEVEPSKAGGLKIGEGVSIQEMGTIVNISKNIQGFKTGDKILFKAWALDIITIDNEKYYFIDALVDGLPNPAICAIIRQ